LNSYGDLWDSCRFFKYHGFNFVKLTHISVIKLTPVELGGVLPVGLVLLEALWAACS